jgi:hypothetical protein
LRLIGVYGANDATNEWTLISTATTSGVAGGTAVGGFLQGARAAGGKDGVWGGISDAIDRNGAASSVSGAQVIGHEVDVEGNKADDASNSASFGGVGVRKGINIVAVRNNTADMTQYEVSNGLWFTAGTFGATVADAYTNYRSVIGFGVNTQAYQALDTRGAIVPAGYTDPFAAVRLAAGQIIDFSGGTALNSAAGRYLQYASSGAARLRYMNGATELLSISDAGAVTVGSLSASGTVSGAGFTSLLAPYALTTNVPVGSGSTPVMDGTAAAGTATTWARADHVHPTDTSRAPAASPTFTGTVGLASAKWTGSTLSICQPTSGSQFMCLNDTGATLASYFNYRYVSGTNSLVMETAGAAANLLLQGNSGGTVLLPLASMTGGTINGTPIGGTTAASGKFTTFGANSATPSGKVTVTGSRSGNAALASLLTAMATFGLIADSTTA